MSRILWVDDEISLLKPHILYLEKRGYSIDTATNGFDAVRMVFEKDYDLVILDEMMVGIDGLETLRRIKTRDLSIKAVMVTKSEEEGIFLEAVGNMIDDYLTKPVTPLQLYLTVRKNLEKENILNESISKGYIKNYRVVNSMLEKDLCFEDWISISNMMTVSSVSLDGINDPSLSSTFEDLKSSVNTVFGNYIQKTYPEWISGSVPRPVMSVDIVKRFLIPSAGSEKQVFIVIDCMSADQMSVVEDVLRSSFSVLKDHYFSILPTLTQFARNSIFSGMFPSETEVMHPEVYAESPDDEKSVNRHEKKLLETQLKREGIEHGGALKYFKVHQSEELTRIESDINNLKDSSLVVLVVNMVDFLLHNKQKDGLVNEMLQSESSYRSTIKSWFENSSLLRIIKLLGELGFKIILTTDHGAKLVKKFTKVSGDGPLSSGLRMKYGKNIKVSNKKQTIFWQKPSDYKMPSFFDGMNIVISKEDHCFVFEKGLNDFYKQIKNTFQHGGVSIEEMILPVLTLKTKK